MGIDRSTNHSTEITFMGLAIVPLEIDCWPFQIVYAEAPGPTSLDRFVWRLAEIMIGTPGAIHA